MQIGDHGSRNGLVWEFRLASIVAMYPLPIHPDERQAPNVAHLRTHWFLMGEKPGLDMTTLQGYAEPDNEEEEDEDAE